MSTAAAANPAAVVSPGGRDGFESPGKTKREGERLHLPAYEVRESAFSDFGMSVKTNFEVKWGGHVEWMLVTGVDPNSSAAHRGLLPGDRIMAIDDKLIPEVDRDAMLSALFYRKKGDRVRLLVLGQREALPRFVQLSAHGVDRSP